MSKPDFVKTMTEFDWKSAIPKVRALHVARACEAIGVHEEGGNNKGPWIKRFLASVLLGQGYSWCAAFVYWCLMQAGADPGKLPKARSAASVASWVKWAKAEDRLTKSPARYMLGFWLDGGKGHIFFVREVKGSGVWTLEGNTNAAGSREGDAVAEKFRCFAELQSHSQYGFISLDGIGEAL